jgi:cell wall-associated NlpC family hydrolase
MKKEATILVLALLVESTFVLDAGAERLNHHPWFAHHSDTEFTAEPSARRLSRSMAVDSGEEVTVASKHARATGSAKKGDRIVEQANRYRGVRYRFGGDSKYKGFDCSGLVSRIYNDLNLAKVPHNSQGLYHMGKPIHLSELRPGDLVFFKNTYKHGISHVGVYAGHNQFIHARNRHYGVTITSLADPYYQLHYAGARRLY